MFAWLRRRRNVTIAGMGHVEVTHLEFCLPDGRALFDDASLRVGEGASVALVGANGAGKTTLLRLIAGELKPDAGTVMVSGGLGVMPQFVGSVRGSTPRRERILVRCLSALSIDPCEYRLSERAEFPVAGLDVLLGAPQSTVRRP